MGIPATGEIPNSSTRSVSEGIIPKFTYIPFSVGPRRCIGEPMAMMEIMIHLAILAPKMRFSISGKESPAIEARVNLRAANGIVLQPQLRKPPEPCNLKP